MNACLRSNAELAEQLQADVVYNMRSFFRKILNFKKVLTVRGLAAVLLS